MAEKLVHTGYGDGRSDFPIKLYVTYTTSQDNANNKSTINCGMYVTTPSASYDIGPWGDSGSYLGTTDNTFTAAIPNFGGKRTLASDKTFTVKHNDDGTGKATIYWKWGVNSSWGGFVRPSGSFEIDLPTIPRHFSSTPKFELTDKTETTASFKWTAPETAGRVQYRIGNGNWVDVSSDANSKTGTFTVSGLDYNTNYTIYLDLTRRDSGLWCQTKPSVPVKTYDIPYCNSRPDFTLGENVTLGFYNPLGRRLTFSIIGPDGSETTDPDWSITGESYTGVSATASVDKLYKSRPNNDWGYYRVKTSWNGYSWTSPDGQNRFFISKSVNKPIFNESNIINVKDTLLVDTITGDASKIIKGHNTITGSITKMSTKNYATGVRYTINSNATPSYQELNYDSGATKTFSFNNLTSNSFTVTAYDSRGFDTPIPKSVNLIDYSTPKISKVNVNRQNGLGNYAVLSANGTYTNWSGLKTSNRITKLWFRYKKATDTTWSNWNDGLSSNVVSSNGQWSINVLLNPSFDTTSKYDFQFTVEDLLEECSIFNSSLSTANGFLWRDLRNKRLGINKKPTCALDVNGNINADGNIHSVGNISATGDISATGNVSANEINSPTIHSTYMLSVKGINVNENNGRINDLEFKDRTNKQSMIRNDLLSNAVDTMSSKPGEGFIETRFWDAAGWDTQMFYPNNSSYSPHIRYRNANADGHWDNWKRFIMEDDVSGKLIYDSGSNSNGRWIRFTDGTMICSNTVKNIYVHLKANLSGRGVVYYGYNDNWTSYPQTFAEVPNCTMNINTGSNVFCIQPYANGYTNKPPGFYPIGVDNGLAGYITVSYVAHGRWK